MRMIRFPSEADMIPRLPALLTSTLLLLAAPLLAAPQAAAALLRCCFRVSWRFTVAFTFSWKNASFSWTFSDQSSSSRIAGCFLFFFPIGRGRLGGAAAAGCCRRLLVKLPPACRRLPAQSQASVSACSPAILLDTQLDCLTLPNTA